MKFLKGYWYQRIKGKMDPDHVSNDPTFDGEWHLVIRANNDHGRSRVLFEGEERRKPRKLTGNFRERQYAPDIVRSEPPKLNVEEV
jgi:hypothetical protein